MKNLDLPYTHAYPPVAKILTTSTLLLFLIPLLFPGETIQVWKQSNWILRAVLLLACAGIPISACEIWLQRTVFTREGIDHRSKFGGRYFKSYAEVESFSANNPGIRVTFEDGRKLYFRGYNAWKVMSILQAKTSPEGRAF
jgi:hypothetical protein